MQAFGKKILFRASPLPQMHVDIIDSKMLYRQALTQSMRDWTVPKSRKV
jgi:hypothetical protein